MPSPRFDPRTPFDRATARRAGISVSELLGHRFRKLFYDCYVSAEVPMTVELRAKAAISLSAEGAYASCQTAARLWGGAVPHDPDVHISVPREAYRSRRQGIRAHVGPADARIVTRRGIPASDPTQTFLDLASVLGLVDLVVLGDSLVANGVVMPQELVSSAARWSGRNAKLARRAAALVREGVDSPMETKLRLLIVLAGLPEPVVNHRIIRENGSVRYRLDLCYPAWKIAIEYDGRQHAESSEQWQSDIERREGLDSLRWRLIIALAADIYVNPAAFLARLVAALKEAGVVGVGVRGSDWQRYFPGRRRAA